MASVDADPTGPSRPAAARAAPPLVRILSVAAVVLLLDQLSKWWAVETLSDRTIEVVWTLRFRLVRNFGASFSSFDGQGPLISLIVVGVALVLVYTGRTQTRPLAQVAFGMVLGGALGNLIDRMAREGDGFLRGGVVDFVDVQWWPVWNVADMAVVGGVLLLLFVSFTEPEPAPPTEPDPPADDESP